MTSRPLSEIQPYNLIGIIDSSWHNKTPLDSGVAGGVLGDLGDINAGGFVAPIFHSPLLKKASDPDVFNRIGGPIAFFPQYSIRTITIIDSQGGDGDLVAADPESWF